jgi:hypothetical protein
MAVAMLRWGRLRMKLCKGNVIFMLQVSQRQ